MIAISNHFVETVFAPQGTKLDFVFLVVDHIPRLYVHTCKSLVTTDTFSVEAMVRG